MTLRVWHWFPLFPVPLESVAASFADIVGPMVGSAVSVNADCSFDEVDAPKTTFAAFGASSRKPLVANGQRNQRDSIEDRWRKNNKDNQSPFHGRDCTREDSK